MNYKRSWCCFGFCLALIFNVLGGEYQSGDDRDATRMFETQVQNNQPINMTRAEISTVSSTVIAKAPDHLLNKLSRTQLAGVGDSITRSRNMISLNVLMTKLNKENAVILASEMSKSPENLTRNTRVNLVQDLIKKLGKPETWTKVIVHSIGGELLKGINSNDVKNMAQPQNKLAFAALADVLLRQTGVSRSLYKTIGDGAKRILGDPDKWDPTAIGRFSKFLSPKDLRKMNPNEVSQAVNKLAKLSGLKLIQAQELVKKLSASNTFGNIAKWEGSTLKRLGQLAAGLTTAQIRSVSVAYAFDDAIEELGKVNLTFAQAREIVKRIKSVIPVYLWPGDKLKKSGNLTKGLDPKDLTKSAVEGAMETLKTISTELSLVQRRTIAEKIDEPSLWSSSKAAMIGNLCFGKTTEELRKIKVASIESLIENLKPETAQVDAQKRALKSKFFSLIPINLRKAGPLCDVITLHGLENTDVEGEIGLSGHYNRTWMPWRTDQASQLIEKIKDLKGESSTWDESTIRIVSDISLLRGLSRDNISRISLSNFTLEQFSDDKYLLDGQKDALIKAFESKRGFSRATLGGVESMGDILINTEKDYLEQMSRDLALQAILQMGGVDLKDRPYLWIKQKLDIAMKIMRRKDASQLTSDDIILLGNLICGMTSSHFKEMNNEAYNDIIDFIGERLCFDSSQLKALADKAKEVLKKKRQVGNVLSIVTGGELSEMGCIVEGFSPNDLRNLSENTIRANIDFLATRNFSGEQARVLMEKLDSKQRQGQDIVLDISSLTGEDLIQRRNILVGLSPADIVNINNTSYDEAATVVGEINGFTRKQLEAWATKAKQAWNRNVALFTSSQLLRLGNVAIGFSDDDIRQMALETDDVIQYLGSQKIQIGNNPGYTSSQLKSALSRIKDHKDKAIKQFTSNEISNFKNFAVAMATDEIDSIDKSAFLSCIGQLGTLKGWSVGQMKKLKYKAIEAYQQPINKWTPAQLRGAGSVIGGCTSSELKLFTEEQVSMVTPDAIKSIPPSLFASFTSSQLRQFDLSQSAAVTSEQLKELSSENEGIIKRKTGYEKPQVSGVQQVLFVDSPTVLILCIAVLLQDLLNHGFFTMCTSQLAYLL